MGNIENATITIKPLTIIAGENSSGKTFLTKSLYTILNSIYRDHFTDTLINRYGLLHEQCSEYFNKLKSTVQIDDRFQLDYTDYIPHIEEAIGELAKCTFPEQEDITDEHREMFDDFFDIIIEYFNNRKKLKKLSYLHDRISSILETVEKLSYIIDNRNDVVVDRITESLRTGFKKNYQITNLQDLINKTKTPKREDSKKEKKEEEENELSIDIENIGNIGINHKSNISFSFNNDGIQKVQDVKNIVFFDSPVYIKIRKALEKTNSNLFRLMMKDEDKYLKGYPEYLEKLYNFIDKEYIDIPDFDEVSQEIQRTISGKLDITKSGDIHYKDERGNSIPLSLTAMGISNIGLIDLLLRNNVINHGSFLIMDEPEVHLHPIWQVALAKILYKIAKGGATIIIATHSLDFLKAFQVLLDEEPIGESIISVNKMPFDNNFAKLSEYEKIDTILDDLSRPYCDLFT